MLEVADVIRAAGVEVCARLAVLPSQKRVLEAMLRCRTASLGGHVYRCEHCQELQYSFHSCGNRHCPKCHGQQTEQWLEQQRARLLPCAYYLVTMTLPAQLRALARSQQKRMYGLMLKNAAASLQKLCADPRWLGAQPSIVAVLHTWTRAMLYHPHVHLLVSAGGLSADGQQWVTAKHPTFLVPVKALSLIFRAKMRDSLKAAGQLQEAPAVVWDKDWVVHVQHAGSGNKALEYLARYVFRIAITNSRLEKLDNGQVTLRYRDNRTQEFKRLTLCAAEFVQRFLTHVLPKGFAKVRHYGLASSACGARHAAAMALLKKSASQTLPISPAAPVSSSSAFSLAGELCPHCRIGRLVWMAQLRPQKKIPP